MTIAFRVLGEPGRDNALFVWVNTGRATHRLLCDCGQGCLDELPLSEVQAVDHLLLSHLHMDHIAGFDALFRRTFNRREPPNLVWGPPATGAIMQHRFRGFMWNLADQLSAEWHVHDIFATHVERRTYAASDAFATLRDQRAWPHEGPLIAHPDYSVTALLLDHGTPSVGYLIREAPRRNVLPERLAELGLPPGPWLQQLKQPREGEPAGLVIAGRRHELATLRAALLREEPGGSLAYLTDFALDDAELERLADRLRGCDTLVCEAQYREADGALARRHRHMTAARAAQLAARAGVAHLLLFHLSDRYHPDERGSLLAEARAIFPGAELPPGWAAG